jgi:hypothetical protein
VLPVAGFFQLPFCGAAVFARAGRCESRSIVWCIGARWKEGAEVADSLSCCEGQSAAAHPGHGLAAVGCSSACYDGGNLRSEQASCLRCDLACRSAVLARVASMATAGQSFDCARTAHTRLTATPAVVATPFANAGLLLLAAVLLKAASRGKIVCQQKRF